ncbi:MAG: DUF3667 domain-containing protein [Sphingobacteriia bacterium]|nr:MAG: DUF3667 domain-containing protein [Sphingobacteriia bacterium]
MSHLLERAEKTCLNCNAILHGRFCHVCGQENIEPRETFGHMVTHFVFDLFHFDGKFFSTIKYLLFKPGFLSQEHIRGRRADYLHPIRMYVFTSAFFFLMFFTFFQKTEDIIAVESKNNIKSTFKKLDRKKIQLLRNLKDSTLNKDSLQSLIQQIKKDSILLSVDSTKVDSLPSFKTIKTQQYTVLGDTVKFKTIASYEAYQQKLPISQRDGFLKRKTSLQSIHWQEEMEKNGTSFINKYISVLLHAFPKVLFISMPLFAFMYMLLYIRRKTFYYSDHLVYTIHLYCAFFLIIFFGLLSNSLLSAISTTAAGWGDGIITLLGLFYWYKSIRNFYAQSRKKTILKFFIIFICSLFLFILVFGLYAIGLMFTV